VATIGGYFVSGEVQAEGRHFFAEFNSEGKANVTQANNCDF
jgi:hypothetical protein